MQAGHSPLEAPTLRMIEAMTVCAYELGTAAAAVAKTAGNDLGVSGTLYLIECVRRGV